MPFQLNPRPILIQPSDPTVRLIPLTQGYITRVSAIDYDDISKWNWLPFKSKKGKNIVYAQRWSRGGGKRKRIFLHKQIFPQWDEVDHIDGDGLNNLRDNLRECLHSQNGANRSLPNSNNTSGYKGVFFHIRDKYWFSSIGINGKYTWLGRATDAIEAARMYDVAALEAFGNFASTNFPLTDYADKNVVDTIKKAFKPAGYISISVRNKSGYKGVSWNAKAGRWQVEGRANGTRFYLGFFPPTDKGKVEAAETYDRWVIQHRSTTAYTNFPRDHYPDLLPPTSLPSCTSLDHSS